MYMHHLCTLLYVMPQAVLVSPAPASRCMPSLTVPMKWQAGPAGMSTLSLSLSQAPTQSIPSSSTLAPHPSSPSTKPTPCQEPRLPGPPLQGFHLSGLSCAGLSFSASAVESYGFLDQQVLDFVRHICVAAASTGKVTFDSFLDNMHRELTVALAKGIHAIIRAGVHLYTLASGHARIPSYLLPTAEIE
jgi:hypothetical protein